MCWWPCHDSCCSGTLCSGISSGTLRIGSPVHSGFLCTCWNKTLLAYLLTQSRWPILCQRKLIRSEWDNPVKVLMLGAATFKPILVFLTNIAHFVLLRQHKLLGTAAPFALLRQHAASPETSLPVTWSIPRLRIANLAKQKTKTRYLWFSSRNRK